MRRFVGCFVMVLAFCGWLGVASEAKAQEFGSITAFVVANGGEFDTNPRDFDILLASVVAADLAAALDDPAADLTLFAPNDQAFIVLARTLGYRGVSEAGAFDFIVGALTELGGGDPIPLLTDILLYHVSPTSITPRELLVQSLLRQPIDTLLDGATIQPRGRLLEDNAPAIDDPSLTLPLNVVTGNGIIHTINGVLLPIAVP